jgi:nucleoside-diphosphate-sugar epimerase
MKILVTGGTGFVGRPAVARLLENGHSVTLLARSTPAADRLPADCSRVEVVLYDIAEPSLSFAELAGHDALLHLAWDDLNNYRALSHISRTLGAHCSFLENLVRAGIPRMLVAGTVFEYGMLSGCLSEEHPIDPVHPYAAAKDTLRRFLQALQREVPFCLQWARLFYMHGDGQSSRSLIGQLDRAIDAGEAVFPMSGGEQLRDYSPVATTAARLVRILETADFDGIVNLCSGAPISVRRLVEEHIAKRNASIQLELGRYPYPDHEPMAYWGDSSKLNQVLAREGELP